MAQTPRKSSTASHRRGPASLRAPSANRLASNPHLSLIFAQGGSTLPPDNPTMQSKRPGTHASLSEEALSRQLDGDLGGKQMGLRSRRSSAGTVRTVHTASGIRSPSPSHSVAEVMEEDEAGPSSAPPGPQPMSDIRSDSSQRLNPESSTSWLRWNSPSSSVPRPGTGVEKGKGKISNVVEEKKHVPHLAASESPASFESLVDPLPCSTLQHEVTDDPQPSPSSPRPPGREKGEGISAVPASSQLGGRGWWGRIPSVNTSIEKGEQPVIRRGKEFNHPNDKASHRLSPPDTANLAGPRSSAGVPTSPETLPPPVLLAVSSRIATQSAASQTQSGRWQEYFCRGEGRKSDGKSMAEPPSELREDHSLSQHGSSALSGLTPGDSAKGISWQIPSAEMSAPSPSPSPLSLEPSAPAASVLPLPSSPSSTSTIPGWSSYLYSFAVPPRPSKSPASDPPPLFVEPTSFTTDQKPISVENSSISVEPAPVESILTDSLSLQSPSRTIAPSNTSSAGWLSYLAIGSAQRKPPSNSIQSTNLSKTAIPTDSAHEELMDFSGDPEFPSAATLASSNTDDRSQPIPAKKASQTRAVRKDRLSFSSTRSGDSATLLPSSPKSQSLLDGKTSSAPSHSRVLFSSSILTPPQTQGAQPNFVIPTFAATFDRPPRSFSPVAPLSRSTTSSQPTGITAATTGLAWKAFGAVGGYVYGGVSESALPGLESQTGNEKEMRGRKDGRRVGGNLPRRIGLQSGLQDDGWKGVRRVVVVGVHGWFPAKMMNSLVIIAGNEDLYVGGLMCPVASLASRLGPR